MLPGEVMIGVCFNNNEARVRKYLKPVPNDSGLATDIIQADKLLKSENNEAGSWRSSKAEPHPIDEADGRILCSCAWIGQDC
jgi:hypothetical protein